MTLTRPDVDAVALRVRAEFVEMPGLSVTPAQAARLWGLDKATCQVVIDQLVEAAFLRKTHGGAVTRAA
jgi:hypothetical protein